MGAVRSRLFGQRLSETSLNQVVRDVVAGSYSDVQYSDVQLSAFVTAGTAVSFETRRLPDFSCTSELETGSNAAIRSLASMPKRKLSRITPRPCGNSQGGDHTFTPVESARTVFTKLSGLSEIESIPFSIRNSANSG